MAYLDSLQRYRQSELDAMSNEELEAIASFLSLDWCSDEFFDEKGELKRDRCILSILLLQWFKGAEGEAKRQPSQSVIDDLIQSAKVLVDLVWKLPLLLGESWRSEQRDNGDWEVVHIDGYRLLLYIDHEILYTSFRLSGVTVEESGRAHYLNQLLCLDELPFVKVLQFHLPTTSIEDLAEILIRDRIPKLESLQKICLEREKEKFWEIPCIWEVTGVLRLKKSQYPKLDDATFHVMSTPGSRLVREIKNPEYHPFSLTIKGSDR